MNKLSELIAVGMYLRFHPSRFHDEDYPCEWEVLQIKSNTIKLQELGLGEMLKIIYYRSLLDNPRYWEEIEVDAL